MRTKTFAITGTILTVLASIGISAVANSANDEKRIAQMEEENPLTQEQSPYVPIRDDAWYAGLEDMTPYLTEYAREEVNSGARDEKNYVYAFDLNMSYGDVMKTEAGFTIDAGEVYKTEPVEETLDFDGHNFYEVSDVRIQEDFVKLEDGTDMKVIHVYIRHSNEQASPSDMEFILSAVNDIIPEDYPGAVAISSHYSADDDEYYELVGREWWDDNYDTPEGMQSNLFDYMAIDRGEAYGVNAYYGSAFLPREWLSAWVMQQRMS